MDPLNILYRQQARSQDFFFLGGGGGSVVWRGRGIFARGFLLPLNQYITNSGMIIVFYYRPTQSRLDLNGPL